MAQLIGAIVWFSTFLIGLIVLAVTWFRHRNIPRDGNGVREFIYIFPFAVWTIGANLLHLFVVQARLLAPVLEILLFSAWWWFVFQTNRQQDCRWRTARILLSFALQLGIMYLLRYYVY